MLSAGIAAVPIYQAPAASPAPPQWIYVTRRFDQLIDGIGIRPDEIDDGTTKLSRVIASLNRCYWNHSSETLNATLLGSWAKQTRVRPFSDIDVMFVLPWDVYWRFEKRLGNKQSQLLQELRTNLRVTYPRTDIRGDGQVVIVTVDGVTIEIVPAFRFDDGRLMICDTNNDGRYKWADPAADGQFMNVTDTLRSRVDDGRLLVHVDNYNMGGDPLPGAHKWLRVLYMYNGQRQNIVVDERTNLQLP